MSSPSAANSCLPPESPVIHSEPPVPQATRGVRCQLDGRGGRLNATKPLLMYHSGKSVVTRTLDDSPLLPDHNKLPVLVYRGHLHQVSAAKVSPSGAYVCSGDERGQLRVWALDHIEHLCKYEATVMKSIRDVDWDSESKRLAVGGERLSANAQCALALQWDGVSAGLLSQFQKGRAASVAFKPNRPFRIVTGGMDEPKCYFHKGPPFQRIPPENGVPSEAEHTRGGVQSVRYNSSGNLVVSVGTDRSVILYDGTTFQVKAKLEGVHSATIFAVAWSPDDKHLLTASGDGTCKLLQVEPLQVLRTWNPAQVQAESSFEKVPVGGTQMGCAFCQEIPVSVGYNGQLSVMSMTSDDIKVMTGHYAPIEAMAVSQARGVFYTGDTNGILCEWDLATTKPRRRLVSPEGNPDLMYVVHGTTDRPAAISGLAVTPKALYSVGWDDNLYVADSNGTIGDPVALGAQPNCIASGTNLGVIVTVKGLMLVNEGAVGDIIPIPYVAKSICVASNDKTIYVGGDDCKIHIYSTDGSTVNETNVIEGKHLKPVHALALSNDGTMLASGDEKDICVFNLSDNTAIIGRGRWCFHLQRITCLAWSADDKVIASGGADDSIYLWSIDKKMKRIHYPFAHRGGLTGLSFLKDWQLLSVGVDSVVNRWDVCKDVQEKFG